jgi:hypothetical protein
LELKISRLKISRSMVDFEDEKKALIPSPLKTSTM